MDWITDTFKVQAATKGALLSKNDILFIEQHLYRIPALNHKRIMRMYLLAWCNAMNDDNSQMKQAAGREAAQSFLRNYTKGS